MSSLVSYQYICQFILIYSSAAALRVKDELKHKQINCYFDVDDLRRISKSKLEEGISQSCCVLLILVGCH